MKSSILLFICIIPVVTIGQNTKIFSESTYLYPYGTVTKKASCHPYYPYMQHGKTEYYRGNQLIRYETYFEGVLDGPFQENFIDGDCKGKASKIGINKNGLYNGKLKEYGCSQDNSGKNKYFLDQEFDYDMGVIITQTNFDYDLFSLKFKKLCDKYNIKDFNDVAKEIINRPRTSGVVKQYYPDGKIALEKKTDKEVEIYYKNGKKAIYVKDGYTDVYDELRIYNHSGKLIQMEIKGVSCFYPNGQIKQSGDTVYYESGKIKSCGIKEYYENGQLKTDGINKYFEDGKREYFKDQSFEITYNTNGIIIKEKELNTGISKEFYSNGTIKFKGKYSNTNKKIGRWINYDESGKIKEINIFDNIGAILTVTAIRESFLSNFGTRKGNKIKPFEETKLLFAKIDPILFQFCDTYNINKDLDKKIFDEYYNFVEKSISIKETFASNNIMQTKFKEAKTEDDVKGFIYYYDSIEPQSKKITETFSKIESTYSIYSNILKQEIKSLSSEIKSYNETYYSESKFNNGKRLIDALNLLDKNFEFLKQNDNEISTLKLDFENNLQNSKPNKQLYKKGSSLLSEQTDILEQEGNSTKRIEIGNNILLPLLKKLISLSSSDNVELNLKLKEAKTSDEIKKLLEL